MSDSISRKEYARRMKVIGGLEDKYLKVSKEYWIEIADIIQNSVDVDKVLEQLEESRYFSEDCNCNIVEYQSAINIVKGGSKLCV